MKINRKDAASILIFIALIICFVLLINGITAKNNGRELQVVRDAVKNAGNTISFPTTKRNTMCSTNLSLPI